MDSFDDFQIKPLTEGLGFHKKAVNLKESVEKSGVLRTDVAKMFPTAPPKSFIETEEDSDQDMKEVMKALDQVSSSLENSLKDTNSFREPATVKESSLKDIEILPALPRKNETVKSAASFEIDTYKPNPPVSPSRPTTYDQPLKITSVVRDQSKEKPKESTSVRRGAADSPTKRPQPVSISLPSMFLDVIVVLAISLLFLVSLLLVTGVNLSTIISTIQVDPIIQVSMAMLYVTVLQMYVIVARSFYGKTLGEWTFELQLGDDKQIASSIYPVLVLWRSLITVVTGVVLLPFLSLLVGKDLASYLTGLQLYKKS